MSDVSVRGVRLGDFRVGDRVQTIPKFRNGYTSSVGTIERETVKEVPFTDGDGAVFWKVVWDDGHGGGAPSLWIAEELELVAKGVRTVVVA